MDLFDRIERLATTFATLEPSIQAFLPEDGRFDRLVAEARSLYAQYPDAEARPPLFGVLAGIKDIFHADGFTTRAGSRLPPAVMQGQEAAAVSRLRRAGALIVGKTVTTEFAHSAPGPTRNPRNTEHTPGGSSSGSAAAVAADLCDIALGTQTIGSVIRPAAYCGVVGVKPTYGRISPSGVIPLAPSLDHVGCLAADLETAVRVLPVLCSVWDRRPARSSAPALAIPEGPYLDRVGPDTSAWFEQIRDALLAADFELRVIPLMPDYSEVCERHQIILAAEAARVHKAWFDDYEDLYGPQIADLIRRGRAITDRELQSALAGQAALRSELRRQMSDARIDAWICPATLGPAPKGLQSTGDPVMNLPWTQAGLPVATIPAGERVAALPMGLQIVGNWHEDESLLEHALAIHRVIGATANGQEVA
jgi:Asp-tRNA(Asn)/Glu-tRNA(Gln) amidotransferase A subunit family amidase